MTDRERRQASRQHRAMTTQALKALRDREDAKRRTHELTKAQGQQKQLFIGLGAAILLAGITYLVTASSDAGQPRAGEERGRQAAQQHIERDHFVLHTIQGQELAGVEYKGAAWKAQMRARFKVYVTHHSAESSANREGWAEYCRAYNETMLAELNKRHGPGFMGRAEQAAKEAAAKASD